MPNTVRLHRVLTRKPDKVYRAFIEPDAMAKWLPPNGFTCTVHHMDPKASGSYGMSFRNFTLRLTPGTPTRGADREKRLPTRSPATNQGHCRRYDARIVAGVFLSLNAASAALHLFGGR
jgi:Activator of Hsp90 ATPase homolog 1-like protein